MGEFSASCFSCCQTVPSQAALGVRGCEQYGSNVQGRACLGFRSGQYCYDSRWRFASLGWRTRQRDPVLGNDHLFPLQFWRPEVLTITALVHSRCLPQLRLLGKSLSCLLQLWVLLLCELFLGRHDQTLPTPDSAQLTKETI